MNIEITQKNADRLIATAQAEGVSVDAYVERLMNERDEFAAIVERACEGQHPSVEDAREKIERGYLQSERGDIVDGDAFCRTLLADLDELERSRRTG